MTATTANNAAPVATPVLYDTTLPQHCIAGVAGCATGRLLTGRGRANDKQEERRDGRRKQVGEDCRDLISTARYRE